MATNFSPKQTNSLFRIVLFLSCISISSAGLSQSFNFSTLTLSEALSEAAKLNKIVFIQLESECTQCNGIAEKGLSGAGVKEIYEKFICIKIGFNTDDYKKTIKTYRFYQRNPSSLFVDSSGTYLASLNNYSTTNANEYIKLAAKAMVNKDNPPHKALTEAIAQDKYDKEQLRQFITLLISENFNTDDLTERYYKNLTLAELEKDSEIDFLIRTSPLIGSRLYKLIWDDSKRFHKIFDSIPIMDRIKINNMIIERSKEKAINEKNLNYMWSVCNYIRNTYGNKYQEGNRAHTMALLDYYKGVKDVEQYVNHAKIFFDTNFNKTNMDSISKAELNQTIKRADGAIMKGGKLYKTGNQLNEIAFSIYQMTDDKEYLGFALKLSEKTLIYKYPDYIDTYAQILYRIGGKKEAIEMQQKAVNISDSLHRFNPELKKTLSEMQNDKL